jgi:hypothetical protein
VTKINFTYLQCENYLRIKSHLKFLFIRPIHKKKAALFRDTASCNQFVIESYLPGVGTGTQTQTQPFNCSRYDSAQNPGSVPPEPAGGRLMGLEIDPVCPPGGVPGGVGQMVGGGSGGSTIG